MMIATWKNRDEIQKKKMVANEKLYIIYETHVLNLISKQICSVKNK